MQTAAGSRRTALQPPVAKQLHLAGKLQRATPHWTRHTHATHLLEGGAKLTTVRDNLRHALLATTSMYLHTDDAIRARQVADRFSAPRP